MNWSVFCGTSASVTSFGTLKSQVHCDRLYYTTNFLRRTESQMTRNMRDISEISVFHSVAMIYSVIPLLDTCERVCSINLPEIRQSLSCLKLVTATDTIH